MAVRAAAILIFAVVFAAAITAEGGHKAAEAAAPPVDCSSVVMGMADCLSYVSNGSTTETPEGNCCPGLKDALKTNPACLCQAFQQSAQFGVVLNDTKALALPAACGVHAPSATKCTLAVSPAAAPTGAVLAPAGSVVAPAGAPSSSIAYAPSSGSDASEMSPAGAPSKTSSSSSISVSAHLIVAGIAAALFTSF